jgi:hypothetical protein
MKKQVEKPNPCGVYIWIRIAYEPVPEPIKAKFHHMIRSISVKHVGAQPPIADDTLGLVTPNSTFMGWDLDEKSDPNKTFFGKKTPQAIMLPVQSTFADARDWIDTSDGKKWAGGAAGYFLVYREFQSLEVELFSSAT